MSFSFMTGLKFSQLRRWRRASRAPVVVSMNTAPKERFPVVDFEVAIDGGSFGTMSRIGSMGEVERAKFIATFGRRPELHAKRARQIIAGLGQKWVPWVGPEDMMCEDFMLRKTGLDLEEHQRRTVANFGALCAEDAAVPWLPVIQGFALADYLRCIEMYRAAGVDLRSAKRVGVGSVCRRQSTKEGVEIIATMIRLGLRVHAFGFKLDGLRLLRAILTEEEWGRLTADSAAWSKHAWKKRILLPGHYHGPKTANCANCPIYAEARRVEIVKALAPAPAWRGRVRRRPASLVEASA